MQSRTLKIGTRGSPLALWQARAVADALARAHGLGEDNIELCPIKTSGDRISEKSLRDAGGKALFTREIEQALVAGDVHMAVHSMKDMETALPDGLEIACVLARADPRDAFVSPRAASLAALPEGAVVGTSSPRRAAQVKRLRPDIAVVDFRGNVDTRLKKLEDGEADATLLAVAGLARLGKAQHITAVMDPADMLPAVAQGAICVETRAGDEETRALLAPVNHAETALCVGAERAFLAGLGGSCRTPIAAHAELDGGVLGFRGRILSPDGATCHETTREGAADDGEALGADAARELLERAGPGFLETLS